MVNSTEIWLPFPPSLNDMFANRRSGQKGQKGRKKTDRYEAWIVEAGKELMIQRPHHFLRPVVINARLNMPDQRIRDVSNFLKAPEDLLVRHGVIQGDDTRFVRNVSVGLPDVGEDLPVINLVLGT